MPWHVVVDLIYPVPLVVHHSWVSMMEGDGGSRVTPAVAPKASWGDPVTRVVHHSRFSVIEGGRATGSRKGGLATRIKRVIVLWWYT